MNTPRADIVSKMDIIGNLCNKGWCELYENRDGSRPATFDINQGFATIDILREQCQSFLDITGPEELTYITNNPNE